jgi:SPP1 gp7 family putative phage head morphogenesis protein
LGRFGEGGGASAFVKDHRNADDLVPADKVFKEFKSKKDLGIDRAELSRKLDAGESTEEMIDVNDVIATQKNLDADNLDKLIPTHSEWADMKRGAINGPPVVAKIGGKKYLLDGHHRVAAASLQGKKLKADVVDFDAQGKRATGKTAGGIDNWIESFGEQEFDDVYAAITKTMRKTFISGLKSGWTTDEFVQQISSKAPKLSEAAIERVVRTASTDIFNIGRQNVAEESGDVVAYRYMAILEPERTCELCYNADGLEIGIHDPDVDRVRPPAHPRCRCVFGFITAGEEWETDTAQLSDFVNALESEYGGNLR